MNMHNIFINTVTEQAVKMASVGRAYKNPNILTSSDWDMAGGGGRGLTI